MNIKVLVATHKKYDMPKDKCYLPVHVGKKYKEDLGYIGDDTGENISEKNSYYCELTGLYWAWKNLNCDYLGLVHYRRHFTKKKLIYRILYGKYKSILTETEMKKNLIKYDVILPKKRNYYIETMYSHYAHTHYAEHLDEIRKIILTKYPDYIEAFDKVMKSKSGHMFNMFIMKSELVNKYCNWIFKILQDLEKRIDYKSYDEFQARLFGRVSELLLDVWIERNKLSYIEVTCINMESINWIDKGIKFLKAKFGAEKYTKSF